MAKKRKYTVTFEATVVVEVDAVNEDAAEEAAEDVMNDGDGDIVAYHMRSIKNSGETDDLVADKSTD